ncbi:MAG: hypothetical protein L0H63_09570 [Nitrococcus sp.]|nr:hypothetical protein [Nitrococcus sp.]
MPTGPALDKPGWLATKFPWWRLRSGDLAVRAIRLDGPGEFDTVIHNGAYGDQGFIPSGLRWSTPGCWRLTGEVGGDALTLTVLVDR